MLERSSFDFAVVRIVPRVERGEFVNAGVVLFCSTQNYLDCRIGVDVARLESLSPSIDCAMIKAYLDVIPAVCRGGAEAGPIGRLTQRERFHWLVAPRSTIIQVSPVHSGVSADLPGALEKLFARLVK